MDPSKNSPLSRLFGRSPFETLIKHMVNTKTCKLARVGTKENASNVHTKHVNHDTLTRFLAPANSSVTLETADIIVNNHEENTRRRTQQSGLRLHAASGASID